VEPLRETGFIKPQAATVRPKTKDDRGQRTENRRKKRVENVGNYEIFAILCDIWAFGCSLVVWILLTNYSRDR